MATTPGSGRRDIRSEEYDDGTSPSLTPMQEPLDSLDRRGPRPDENDLNLTQDGTVRRAGNLGTTADTTRTVGGTLPERRNRGFTATFAIAAAILVVAFLIALYLGSHRNSNEAMAPGSQAPVADSNTTTNDTTGSTTVAPPQQPAPGTGNAGGAAGSGNTGGASSSGGSATPGTNGTGGSPTSP